MRRYDLLIPSGTSFWEPIKAHLVSVVRAGWFLTSAMLVAEFTLVTLVTVFNPDAEVTPTAEPLNNGERITQRMTVRREILMHAVDQGKRILEHHHSLCTCGVCN